ncbi:MAG: glycosyltransferase, partial [Lachnospiraceae bacterium]|nr:glycosyltransferase [Lachnospiraceae bacterium]
MERLDKKHREAIQRELEDYRGCRYWAEPERQERATRTRYEQATHRFEKEHVFSILVPAYRTKDSYLREMMDSVMRQTYSKVELIIADASPDDGVRRVVEAYKEHELADILSSDSESGSDKGVRYPDIRYLHLEENAGISENTNKALELARGDYIGLLDHDDVLTYDALYEVMCKLQESDYAMVYTDEDKADGKMQIFSTPYIKPEFNLPLLLSNNYICHFTVMQAEVLKKLRLRQEYDGAQDYDLFLRAVTLLSEKSRGEKLEDRSGEAQESAIQKAVPIDGASMADLKASIGHVQRVVYHWRCHELSTADNPESKRYAYEAGKRALQDFCDVHEMAVMAQHSSHLGFYKLKKMKPGSLWERYPHVGGFCGRVCEHGMVIAGPMLDNRVLFAGLREGYSGYINRADFPIEVDAMPPEACVFHPKYEKVFGRAKEKGKPFSFEEKTDYVRSRGDIFVYLPDFERRR